MLIFLTPHVIDDESDLEEVYRIKVAQRQEFIKRFYGKSRDDREKEMKNLLSYSMNHIDQSSRYRGNQDNQGKWQVIGTEGPAGTKPTEASDKTNPETESVTPKESSESNTEKSPEDSEQTESKEEYNSTDNDLPILSPSESDATQESTEQPSE